MELVELVEEELVEDPSMGENMEQQKGDLEASPSFLTRARAVSGQRREERTLRVLPKTV